MKSDEDEIDEDEEEDEEDVKNIETCKLLLWQKKKVLFKLIIYFENLILLKSYWFVMKEVWFIKAQE